MTQIGVWRAQNASKPSENIINTPPKYPQTHLETFFFGSFFTPNRPKTAKSRRPPLGRLLGIRPTASARENRNFGHKSGSGAQNPDFFGSSVAESPSATFRSPENLAETASTGPQIRFFGILAQKRPSPQVPRHKPHCQRARKPVFWPQIGLKGSKYGFFWLTGCGITMHNF